MTSHGKKNLTQLLRHRTLTIAFDALLDIPGLWERMSISTLHKMMAMKCDEVSRPRRLSHPLIFLTGNFVLSESYQRSLVHAASARQRSNE